MEAALERTLSLGQNLNLLSCNSSGRGGPGPKPKTCSSSSSSSSSLSFLKTKNNDKPRLFSTARIKSSFDYISSNNNTASSSSSNYYDTFVGGPGPQYPRPAEIQWKKELCNAVHLIGNVATPVQIKHLASGKVLAWSRLAVKKSQTDTAWINLTFWDELAHVAFQHLEKGQQIYVSGRLVSDTVESDDGKQQTYYKVVVQQINFIERGAAPVALYDGDSNANALTPGRKQNGSFANSPASVEELWQAFFANPVEWWDNRKNKRNPNYPDFKHKDTGEALWVEGRYNPPWVKSQLAILDARMESFHDQNEGLNLNFMAADNFPAF